ncbi:hypothetical protein [Shinella daejeonensis]|nr:hypothetical protein [Shinella daejeonensis]
MAERPAGGDDESGATMLHEAIADHEPVTPATRLARHMQNTQSD